MKKFLMVTPQQPRPSGERPGMLRPQKYETTGNSLLAYDKETCFPLVPLMNGYVGEGEEAEVYTVTYDSENCRYNLGLLEKELKALSTAKGFNCKLESIDVPFDDSTGAILGVFQELIDRTADGDELYADITFGSKPMPLALVMSMQYAYRLKSNVSIDCVVYGQIDRSGAVPTAKIYDVTSLVKLDEIVRLLADYHVDRPADVISEILALQGGSHE